MKRSRIVQIAVEASTITHTKRMVHEQGHCHRVLFGDNGSQLFVECKECLCILGTKRGEVARLAQTGIL